MKAIIVDLDRTLMRSDRTISEYTQGIMRRCRDKGIFLLAATARPERSISRYREQIHFDAVTTMNGARIILPDGVIENGIARDSVKLILSNLIKIGDTYVSIETSDGMFSNADVPEWNSTYFKGFPELPTDGAVFKILVSSHSDKLFKHIASALTDDVYYSVANNELIQIMNKTASKWKGIKAMIEALKIPPAETIFFGDDNDDIEPIIMCGMGVAVSNAIKGVRDEADFITESNDQDGVARFIEKNLL